MKEVTIDILDFFARSALGHQKKTLMFMVIVLLYIYWDGEFYDSDEQLIEDLDIEDPIDQDILKAMLAEEFPFNKKGKRCNAWADKYINKAKRRKKKAIKNSKLRVCYTNKAPGWKIRMRQVGDF